MKINDVITILVVALVSPGSANAFSKLFEDGVAAVIKNVQPCFYLDRPKNAEARRSALFRYDIDVYLKSKEMPLKWHVHIPPDALPAPVDANACIPYGMRLSGDAGSAAFPLEKNRRYQIIFTATGGEYGADFCVRQNRGGLLYVSAANKHDLCLEEPLRTAPKPLWRDWMGL